MPNTMYFTQCGECEHCVKALFGYVCEKHEIQFHNPNVDGCTWGNKKEKDSGLLFADMEEIIDA